jgi:hypothetical protein
MFPIRIAAETGKSSTARRIYSAEETGQTDPEALWPVPDSRVITNLNDHVGRKSDLNPRPAGHIFFRMHPGTNIGGRR